MRDRCIVISGASSGLGAALARHYDSPQATLGLMARRPEALAQLAQSLHSRCCTLVADVRDAAALRQGAAQFMARHGVPDVVIANAGISLGTLTEVADDGPAFQDVIDTNVLGMVHTFQPWIAAMRERGSGVLAGIASVAGYRGLPGASAYSASKAAAISYLESLRVELRDSGITVITVCPGYIVTPMTARNPYRMPFILEADDAARRIAAVIERRRTYAVLPWQMALVARLMHILPRWAYDPLAARAGRKPRRSD